MVWYYYKTIKVIVQIFKFSVCLAQVISTELEALTVQLVRHHVLIIDPCGCIIFVLELFECVLNYCII